MTEIKGFIFDLDGVIVDTARFHYLAWRRLAKQLGFDLTHQQNELLKGVSRMASLDIILGIGGITATAAQKDQWAELKNQWYVEYISAMGADELLPNVAHFLGETRQAGLLSAIGSASKNTPIILGRLGITKLFDAVIDGNSTSRAKPDPEVFLLAAKALGLEPRNCVVFEDSAAGLEAARSAGMKGVGIGVPSQLHNSDLVLRGFAGLNPLMILAQLQG